MPEEPAPYWRLISVLFSSFPLQPAVAMTLWQAARELVERGESSREVAGDLLSGRVNDLKNEAVLGGISGPTFEAKLETARGSGVVRFLVTREGLDGLERAPRPRRPLMN